MSTQKLLLELSLSGQHNEAARIWANEIKLFHENPPNGLGVFDTDGPVTNLMFALEEGIIPVGYKEIFNIAADLHTQTTEATMDRHTVLHYHPHHFNFTGIVIEKGQPDGGENQLAAPDYGVYGPVEREAPAFLYNPIDPSNSRFDEMVSLAMNFEVAKARLDAVVEATGWDRQMVAELLLVRSVENLANRLVKGTPTGQLPPQFWQDYIANVSAPLAGFKL